MQRCVVVDFNNELGYNTIMKTITKYGIKESAKLKTKLIDLLIQRIKFDQFFDKFLDKYDNKMKVNDLNNPTWTVYRAKIEEYENLSREIRSTEHLLRRSGIV